MTDNFEKVGDLIRERREARGWSQEELANRAGTTQQNVGRLEKGLIKHSRFIAPILSALGLDMGRAIAQTAEPSDLIPRELLVGDKGMPLFASTQGGDGALVINFDPIDYLKWPAPLLHVPEGFGVLVEEDSMFPVYEPSDIALVNPKLPPRRGKNCVLLGSTDGTRVKSLIKRYEGQTEGHWKVSQWNPQKDFTLSKVDWPRCMAVVGKYDAR